MIYFIFFLYNYFKTNPNVLMDVPVILIYFILFFLVYHVINERFFSELIYLFIFKI